MEKYFSQQKAGNPRFTKGCTSRLSRQLALCKPKMPNGEISGNKFSRGGSDKEKTFNNAADFPSRVWRYTHIQHTQLLHGNSRISSLPIHSTDTYWEKKWKALLPAAEPLGDSQLCSASHISIPSPSL